MLSDYLREPILRQIARNPFLIHCSMYSCCTVNFFCVFRFVCVLLILLCNMISLIPLTVRYISETSSGETGLDLTYNIFSAMKFRAQLVEKELLFKLLGSMEKMGKQAQVVLTPSFLQLYLVSSATSPVKIRMTVPMEHLFTNVILESIAENSIFFEIGLSNFLQAIKSCLKVPDVVLALTKKESTRYLSLHLKPTPVCVHIFC